MDATRTFLRSSITAWVEVTALETGKSLNFIFMEIVSSERNTNAHTAPVNVNEIIYQSLSMQCRVIIRMQLEFKNELLT